MPIPYPTSKTKPWEHQEECWQRMQGRSGYFIWHQMGLGKTKTVVDACGTLEGHVLIICPLSVIPAWEKQFGLHAAYPIAPLCLDSGGVPAKTRKLEDTLAKAAIRKQRLAVILNYESAFRGPLGPTRNSKGTITKPGLLMTTPWSVLVLDEVHKIKAASGKSSLFCSKLSHRVGKCWGLTGTPMPHSPVDIYAQARAVTPGVFKNKAAFMARYVIMGGFNGREITGYQNQQELTGILHTIGHRVKTEDAISLPEAVHEAVECRLGTKAQAAYNRLQADMVAAVASGEITAANALTRLLRLQQITGGTVRTDSGVDELVDTSKADALQDLLDGLEQDEPMVVFCRFRSDLDAVLKVAKTLGRGCAELSGRVNQLAAWQKDDGPPILAVQIQAGGIGVDLTRARYCTYYSLGYSLGDYEQSLARVHRPGQGRKVIYYHLIAKNTVDGEVYRALRAKRDVIATVIGGLR